MFIRSAAKYDRANKQTTTSSQAGQICLSITGDLTLSFGVYVLRVATDADLVAQ